MQHSAVQSHRLRLTKNRWFDNANFKRIALGCVRRRICNRRVRYSYGAAGTDRHSSSRVYSLLCRGRYLAEQGVERVWVRNLLVCAVSALALGPASTRIVDRTRTSNHRYSLRQSWIRNPVSVGGAQNGR